MRGIGDVLAQYHAEVLTPEFRALVERTESPIPDGCVAQVVRVLDAGWVAP